MWAETVRLVWIWVRITVGLAVALGVLVLWQGWDSTAVKLAAVGAVLLDLLVIRALAREWSWQASGEWWWHL